MDLCSRKVNVSKNKSELIVVDSTQFAVELKELNLENTKYTSFLKNIAFRADSIVSNESGTFKVYNPVVDLEEKVIEDNELSLSKNDFGILENEFSISSSKEEHYEKNVDSRKFYLFGLVFFIVVFLFCFQRYIKKSRLK